MDTPWECRIMDFDEKYRDIYGCYPDEEVYEDDSRPKKLSVVGD